MNLPTYFKSIAPKYAGKWTFDENDTNQERINDFADNLTERALNSGHFEDVPACDINDAATEYCTR